MARRKSFQEYKDYYAPLVWPKDTLSQDEALGNRFYYTDQNPFFPAVDFFYLDEKGHAFYPKYTYLGWGINSCRYLRRIQINA